MKSLSAILAIAILAVCVVASSGSAREAAKSGLRMTRAESEDQSPGLVDPGLRGLYAEAAADTYCLVWYDFETKNWQGWTREDETGQRGTFFHVDNFAGLAGYAPLEGAKSMWCGVRGNPNDPYVCSWATAPGYGNNWNQVLTTGPIYGVGAFTLSFRISYDTEPEYDYVRVERTGISSAWASVIEFTGQGDTTVTLFMPLTASQTKLRFHFTSDGAWSDQDGLYDTNGACVIDSVSLHDVIAFSNFENFESAALGATTVGIWGGQPGMSFGKYSGLQSNLNDKDPCGDDLTSMIVFFIGSTVPSTTYPGLRDTPFCLDGQRGSGALCQNERVISPPIDTRRYSTHRDGVQDGVIPPGELPFLSGFIYRFTVYEDLPLANLVFYQQHIRNIENGCPGQWLGNNFIYYCCSSQGWTFRGEDVSVFVTSDTVQVSLAVVDMCDVWYLVNGNCAQHTPTPWFDNVRLYRYNSSGPLWSYRDIDLFQDNFPGQEFQIESYVRADAANDINTNDNPIIRPGDSIVIDCSSPQGGGIAADPAGGPAVYMHVKCTYIGPTPTKPALYGPSLQGTYGWYKSDDGAWTIIQCDTSRTNAGAVKNKYCVDLNDALFTRGYEIEYYFTARDVAGEERSLPKLARTQGPYFEWTCLPTKNATHLFVDDSRKSYYGSGSVVRSYWHEAWDVVGGEDKVDRYDVNGPSSGVSNGPGSRAKTKQLVDWYRTIVWDCGDYESITISDGTVNSDKSNDCQMLINWFEQSEHICGLWVCGDDVAYDLDGLASTPALTLMITWCGVDYLAMSYFNETGGRSGGGIVYPLITGNADANIFVHGGVPDTFYLDGGCWVLNSFDVLGKAANGKYALSYPVYNATNRYAAIASTSLNPGGFNVHTMWFGFSFEFIRDASLIMEPIREHLARDVLSWMGNVCGMPGCELTTPTEVPSTYRLAQNFPNPFNPTTTIKFDMKAKGLVTIRVYDVAGRLVRTLADEVRDAGAYSILWDGRNNIGTDVASGIYFYKMETTGFQATKKLVLLR